MIELQPKVKLAIMQHTREEYPNECCGYITQKSRVQKYHPMENMHKDPENHFEMHVDEDYADALDAGQVIAIVHSHTGDGATTLPSVADEARCNESGLSWVITSWPEGDMRIIEPKERPLVGRPWSLGSYDCWGLIMEWHRRHGIELKDFRVPYRWWTPEYGENLYQDHIEECGFVRVNRDLMPGDVVIMQLQSNVWNHGGVYVGNNALLHHYADRLSKVDVYSGWWHEHAVAVFRHRDLIEVEIPEGDYE